MKTPLTIIRTAEGITLKRGDDFIRLDEEEMMQLGEVIREHRRRLKGRYYHRERQQKKAQART